MIYDLSNSDDLGVIESHFPIANLFMCDFIHLALSFVLPQRVKMGTSNLAQTLTITSPGMRMTNDPQRGRGKAHVTHFCTHNSGL